MDEDLEMFKIVVIGSSGTGKTNISTRYANNQFSENHKATVGVQFLSKVVKVHNQSIKVTLWDTAGQEKYKSLSKVYYKGSSGVLIVYDVTNPQSYLDVESWMRLANENMNLNEVALMVVGNKVDLEQQRKVPTDRPLKEYKDKFDIDCWQVSAKTGYNVKEVFSELIEKIYQMNMMHKDVFNYGESVVTNSIIDSPESFLGGRLSTKPNNLGGGNVDSRVSKQIQQVIIEQQESVDMTKKKKSAQSTNNKPGQVQKQKGNSNMKLNNKKDNKKKDDKGCC